MHYYGTYAMARAAGLNRGASIIIATAAQFVDDNAESGVRWFNCVKNSKNALLSEGLDFFQ